MQPKPMTLAKFIIKKIVVIFIVDWEQEKRLSDIKHFGDFNWEKGTTLSVLQQTCFNKFPKGPITRSLQLL